MTFVTTLLIWMRDPTSGHLGTKKTWSKVSERFMWQGMVNDVYKLVSK